MKCLALSAPRHMLVHACLEMLCSYAELSHTLLIYFLVPCVTVYVCYVVHGVQESKLIEDRVLAASSFFKKGVPLSVHLGVYFIFFLPIFFFFLTFKGLDLMWLTAVGSLFALNQKWVICLFSLFFFSLALLLVKTTPSTPSLEIFCTYMFIFLSWFFISLSTNVLTFLLGLEVITLLLFILFCSLAGYGNLGYAGIRSNLIFKEAFNDAQHSLISMILSFVWVMGFATIFFLWAVALAFPVYSSVDFAYIALVNANWSHTSDIGLFSMFFLSGSWLGFGLLLKLLIQPFQTLLLIFYRQLPPTILLGYFQFYYVFFIFFIFFFVVTPFGFLTISWHWVFVSYLLGSVLALYAGLETLRDVSTVLAYSTFVNISFFLLVGGYHAI